METVIFLLKIFIIKTKMFWYGFITGAILQYFEIDMGTKKFNPGKFLLSSTIFGFLTQFSFLLIQGELFELTNRNDTKDIVVSVLLASFLYLFIPFVLKPENRGKFIESTLSQFGFTKKK